MLRPLWALAFQAETKIVLLQRYSGITSNVSTEASSGEYRWSHARTLNGTHHSRTSIYHLLPTALELETLYYSESVSLVPYVEEWSVQECRAAL